MLAFREADRVAWAESWSSRSRTGLDAVRVGPTSISSGRLAAQGPRGGLRNPRAVGVFTPWWRAICSPPRSRVRERARREAEERDAGIDGGRQEAGGARMRAGGVARPAGRAGRAAGERLWRCGHVQRADQRRRLLLELRPEPALDSARVRRRPDRRERRAPRRGRLRSRPLSADHAVPRLRRRQDRPRLDAALARPRLRHLLDDRPRLPRVVRLGGITDRRRHGVRRRLRAPDRQPLRGPRRAGVRRPARRREPDRPAADRRDRRLLRRRHVHGARRAQEPQGDARTTASSPGRARTASRCRSRPPRRTSPGPTSPTRCSRTAARSTTSPTLPTRAGSGSRSSRWSAGSTSPGSAHPGSTRRSAPTRLPTSPAGARSSNSASRTARAPQAIVDEITQHHSSYYIDHSIAPAPMLMSSGFTDDLFPADETIRFYNRTRTQYARRPSGAVLRRLRPSAGAEQGRRDRSAAAAENPWMDYYVKGVGAQPPRGRHRLHANLPGQRSLGRAVHGRATGRRGAGRDPPRRRRRRRRSTRAPAATPSRPTSTRSAAAAPARPPTAPTRPAPPPTGSTRPRPAATRCSARLP